MKMIDKFKSMNIDEFIEWLDEYASLYPSPWDEWFDVSYCGKCKPEIVYDDGIGRREYGWCELNGKCRFFQDMDEQPDTKQVIKMWLENEI